MGRNVGHLLNWRPLGVLVFSEKSGDPSKGNAQAARCTGGADCAAREYARPPGGVTNRGALGTMRLVLSHSISLPEQ